jgi:nucleotide-binding universal stress UspA family protein
MPHQPTLPYTCERSMFQPRVILHPTDFSESSVRAYHIAADLARLYGATLVVLHVVETLGPENVTFGEAISQLEPEGYRHRLEADLRHRLPPADPGVAVEYLLVEGDPGTEIERVAQDRGCDLIVLGTQGHSGLLRLLKGSIVDNIIRRAPCPVLTLGGQGSRPATATS